MVTREGGKTKSLNTSSLDSNSAEVGIVGSGVESDG